MNLPDLLQLSPYIIPHERDGSLYFVDYLLNKEIPYPKELRLIGYDGKTVYTREQLLEKLSLASLKALYQAGILTDFQSIWKQSSINKLDIEITTHCNYRCRYCPQSLYPKKKQIMSMDLFETIVSRAVEFQQIHTFMLNHYNEPLLDPFFLERIHRLNDTGIKVILHTNASKLDTQLLNQLLSSRTIVEFVFNLPSFQEGEYFRITKYPHFKTTLQNIQQTIDSGADVTILCNGIGSQHKENTSRLRHIYRNYDNVKVIHNSTHDRAGILNNEYRNDYRTDNLCGCFNLLHTLSVDVNGECFLCCQDYYKENTFGNIAHNTLQEILESDRAVNLRKKVFGVQFSEESFICKKCAVMHENNVKCRLIKQTIRRLEQQEKNDPCDGQRLV